MALVKNRSRRQPLLEKLAHEIPGCHTKLCAVRSGGQISAMSQTMAAGEIRELYARCDSEQRTELFGVLQVVVGGSTNCVSPSVNDMRSKFDVSVMLHPAASVEEAKPALHSFYNSHRDRPRGAARAARRGCLAVAVIAERPRHLLGGFCLTRGFRLRDEPLSRWCVAVLLLLGLPNPLPIGF